MLAYSHLELGSEILFFMLSNLFLPNLTRDRTLAYSHLELGFLLELPKLCHS